MYTLFNSKYYYSPLYIFLYISLKKYVLLITTNIYIDNNLVFKVFVYTNILYYSIKYIKKKCFTNLSYQH